MRKILLITNNNNTYKINMQHIEKIGFQVVVARTLIEAEKIIQEAFPAVILLDIHMLDRNSFEFVRKVCKDSKTIVSFVTMQFYIEQIINGIGGDDFITKLFYPKELMTCEQAQLRRKESFSDTTVIEIDNLRIDINEKEVYKDGKLVNLYTKEKKLLFYLVKNANKVISSQQIIYDIWGRDENANEKTVVVHISTLRRKLGDSYSKGNWIQTVRGFGYKFVLN